MRKEFHFCFIKSRKINTNQIIFIGWTVTIRVYIKRENKPKQKYVWAKCFTQSNSVELCNGLRDDARDGWTLGGVASRRLLPQSANRAAQQRERAFQEDCSGPRESPRLLPSRQEEVPAGGEFHKSPPSSTLKLFQTA